MHNLYPTSIQLSKQTTIQRTKYLAFTAKHHNGTKASRPVFLQEKTRQNKNLPE